MKLILISPETGLQELNILPTIFYSGLQYYHIRKPDFNERELREYLLKVPKDFHNRIIIHSHHQFADEFSLKGIHYPETLRKRTQDYPSHLQISTSFHNVDELKQWPLKFDYAFLSPIFNSISKTGYKSVFDLKQLRNVLPEIDQNIVALGGIDEENIEQLNASGFSGVALLGAIWKSKDPVGKFKGIQEVVKTIKLKQI